MTDAAHAPDLVAPDLDADAPPEPPPWTRAARPYAITASGRFVSLVRPAQEQISLRDIAHHLALAARWSGATATPYSVAQHCVVVAELLPPDPRLRALALLHDGHEYLTGDISRPMKRAIRRANVDEYGPRARPAEPLQAIARRLDAAIHAACGLALPTAAEAEQVAAADDAALWMEARDLCHPHALAELEALHLRPPIAMGGRIKALPWPQAAEKFLAAASRYLPTCPE